MRSETMSPDKGKRLQLQNVFKDVEIIQTDNNRSALQLELVGVNSAVPVQNSEPVMNEKR